MAGHLPAPAHAGPVPPSYDRATGGRVIPGIAYAALPGARPLELDLHLPAPGGPPPPVAVFLHGGGWRSGSRHSAGPAYDGWTRSPFEEVAAGGIAVASVDYRLSGEATWPAPLHDAKAAVRWLRARGAEVGLDPSRMAAWGESAGGHLAAMLGVVGPELAGTVGITGVPDDLCAVVAWYPPTDLSAIAPVLGTDPASAGSREALLLGAPLTEVPDTARQASPVSHVRAGAPPFLLMHGRDDTLVPCDQSARLERALREAGADVELATYPGADHMWRGSPGAAREALARTVDFLGRHLLA